MSSVLNTKSFSKGGNNNIEEYGDEDIDNYSDAESEVEEEDEEPDDEDPADVEDEADEDEPMDVEEDADEAEEDPVSTQVETFIGGANGDDDDEDDEDDDENYLQKFDSELNKNYLVDFHPESVIHNEDEIKAMTTILRDRNNNIIDDLHKTIPYLTKYEKARILGQRAKQLNAGSKPFVKIPDRVIDGYVMAQLELKQKRIPFIVRRPMPNGGCEYWNLKDLEILDF